MKKGPKLKVGLVFDDSLDSSDGVAQYVKTLGAWLSAGGHSVSYLVGESKTKTWHGGKVYSLSKNLPVKFNGNRLSIPLPSSRKGIKKALSTENFDVLHIMMPHSPFMAQRVVRAADTHTAVVGTFHIFPANWLAKAGGRLLRLSYGSLRRFHKIVSVSSAARQYARDTFSISTEVIPNPVDISKFAGSGQRPIDGRIVFLGRLVPRKGCAQLIEAFSVLCSNLSNATLVIAGDGPQKGYLEKLAARHGVLNRTDFTGFIDETDKPALLASANVACFPSLYGESFGIVLIEAMAAEGGVVLGGDNPGYRSVLAEQPKLLVNPGDKYTFAARLEELLTDKKLSEKLSAWQKQTVRQYDIDVVGNKILNLYEQSIAPGPKNSHNESYGIQKSNG